MKDFKLNEGAIIKRMSNGELSALYGGFGYAQTRCGVEVPALRDCIEEPAQKLCTCLAGCGCTTQRACNTCTAEI